MQKIEIDNGEGSQTSQGFACRLIVFLPIQIAGEEAKAFGQNLGANRHFTIVKDFHILHFERVCRAFSVHSEQDCCPFPYPPRAHGLGWSIFRELGSQAYGTSYEEGIGFVDNILWAEVVVTIVSQQCTDGLTLFVQLCQIELVSFPDQRRSLPVSQNAVGESADR